MCNIALLGPRWRCRYSKLLRNGRSGNRTSVRARITAPRPNRPWAHRTASSMGNGSVTKVKRPRRVVRHPPLSTAEVKERENLSKCSPFVFSSGYRVDCTYICIALLLKILLPIEDKKKYIPVNQAVTVFLFFVKVLQAISSWFRCYRSYSCLLHLRLPASLLLF